MIFGKSRDRYFFSHSLEFEGENIANTRKTLARHLLIILGSLNIAQWAFAHSFSRVFPNHQISSIIHRNLP